MTCIKSVIPIFCSHLIGELAAVLAFSHLFEKMILFFLIESFYCLNIGCIIDQGLHIFLV